MESCDTSARCPQMFVTGMGPVPSIILLPPLGMDAQPWNVYTSSPMILHTFVRYCGLAGALNFESVPNDPI